MINPFEPLGISPTLSEDEVRRLMKTSLDAISVMELNGEL